eukprot:SAG22_NODE_72_length_22344_cov_95.586559_13_plen_337_part_00
MCFSAFPCGSTALTADRCNQAADWLLLWFFVEPRVGGRIGDTASAAGQDAPPVEFRRRRPGGTKQPWGVLPAAAASPPVECAGGWWHSPPVDLLPEEGMEEGEGEGALTAGGQPAAAALRAGLVQPEWEYSVWTDGELAGTFGPDPTAVVLNFPPSAATPGGLGSVLAANRRRQSSSAGSSSSSRRLSNKPLNLGNDGASSRGSSPERRKTRSPRRTTSADNDEPTWMDRALENAAPPGGDGGGGGGGLISGADRARRRSSSAGSAGSAAASKTSSSRRSAKPPVGPTDDMPTPRSALWEEALQLQVRAHRRTIFFDCDWSGAHLPYPSFVFLLLC